MADNTAIITMKSPLNVGLIKYFDDPNVKTLYPINDYVIMTLDPGVVCAKASVCARREFTENEFWLNGQKGAAQLSFCLNEVKYKAANQHSVSMEFLTRKVHIACENNFLPSSGSSSFSAGFISLMTALCKLYKIRPNGVRNQPMFPDLINTRWGGFVQRREVFANTKTFKGKQLAEGTTWPELRVLILVIKVPQKEISTERFRGVQRSSEYIAYRLKETLPRNIKKLAIAVQLKKFDLFADIVMKDNNQFHAINVDTFPPRAYKTEISHKIAEVIHVYNKLCGLVRVAYTFETGPNAILFFLEKDAQEVLGLIKHIFPSTNPNFVQGLDAPPDLEPDHFFGFAIEPQKEDLIKYAIYSKVGDTSVEYDDVHLLDENGDVIYTTPPTSPVVAYKETASSINYSDALEDSDDDMIFADCN